MSDKAFNLMSAFIHAMGYEHEVDKVIDGETFFIVKKQPKKELEKKQDKPEFIEFWGLYPRKTNLEKSKVAFNKLTKAEIILALHDIKTRYDGVDKQYIPHATTYINGKRWQDERIKSSSSKPSGQNTKSKLHEIARDYANSGKSRYSFSGNDT